MSKKNVQRILLLLGFAICTFVLSFVQAWPDLIFAQDDRDEAANRVFLPYVAGSGAAANTNGNAPVPDDGHDHTHPQPVIDAWPPEPEGISDVIWLSSVPSPEIIAAQNAAVAAEQLAVTAAAVQSALGERFVQATTTYLYDKASVNRAVNAAEHTAVNPGPQEPREAESGEVLITYFSYSHNATVEVRVQAGEVKAIKTLPAAVYQPEPTALEKRQVIALARRYFAAQGFARIQQLEGYVIQAYQPEGKSGFYESRVLYVTFHARIDERPEFVAWVDLTQESVINAFQEQYEGTSEKGDQ